MSYKITSVLSVSWICERVQRSEEERNWNLTFIRCVSLVWGLRGLGGGLAMFAEKQYIAAPKVPL